MKILRLLIVSIFVSNLPAVEPPETYIPSRYYDLWRKSAFTDPPPPKVEEEGKNDMEDWVLMGVRKYQDSQIVTVVNSKDRAQRITIPSKDASDLGFAILEVKMERSFLNTEVHLQKGPYRGWVKYDPKFLVVKRAAAPPKSGAKGGKTTGQQSKTVGKGGVPPTPGGTKGATTTSSARKTTTPAQPGARGAGSTATQGGTSTSSKKPPRVRYVPKPKK